MSTFCLHIYNLYQITCCNSKRKNIGGILLIGNEFKITMFADDATLVLDGTLNSFIELVDVLEETKQ